MSIWLTTRFELNLDCAQIMGIVNVTPDSFSDGGRWVEVDAALRHARQLVDEGADILDIGGESTRPGAMPVGEELEWARIAPVIEAVLPWGIPISVDTQKPELMRRALELGADILNDVRGFDTPQARAVAAAHPRAGLCVMHMQGQPQDMQQQALYDDVVREVKAALGQAMDALLALGIDSRRVVLDPGIGFGKSPAHNIALMRRQRELLTLGRPLLVGWSRKSTLGEITGRPVGERLSASVAAAMASVCLGARVIRVHDVAQTRDALTVFKAAGLTV